MTAVLLDSELAADHRAVCNGQTVRVPRDRFGVPEFDEACGWPEAHTDPAAGGES